jgi:hypothetical protein
LVKFLFEPDTIFFGSFKICNVLERLRDSSAPNLKEDALFCDPQKRPGRPKSGEFRKTLEIYAFYNDFSKYSATAAEKYINAVQLKLHFPPLTCGTVMEASL